jgi:hypothetical protein
MTLRTYWCVLSRAETKRWSGKPYFAEVDNGGFSYNLDFDNGAAPALRAALLLGVTQCGGSEADLGQYRMNVFDEDGRVVRSDYTASGAWPPPASLADYTDEQLISELARRIGRY